MRATTRTVLPMQEQHGTTTPVIVPTAVGTYQSMACDAAGCHAQGDIHAIHKDAATCALSGCHDYNLQAKLPVGASCGTGNACHDTADPHAHMTVSHDASAPSMACRVRPSAVARAGFSDAFETGNLANWTSVTTCRLPAVRRRF